MRGSITASCGCNVDDLDHCVMVFYQDANCDAIDGFTPAVTSAMYCEPCAQRLQKEDIWLPDQEAADRWLDMASKDFFAKKRHRDS